MTVFDSNVWIAIFHDEDTLRIRARAIAKKTGTDILLPEYVLIEVCSVLKRLKRKEAADRFLDEIQDNKDIIFLPASPEFLAETIRLFRTGPQDDLSFIDVALLVLSKMHAVVTFDKKLAAAIKKTGRRRPA